MPGFDRTGPMGGGPMTGGRRGFCIPAALENSPVPGDYRYGRGLGLRRGIRCGYGSGMGRGCGRGYGSYPSAAAPVYPTGAPAGAGNEIDMLKKQAESMNRALAAITRRIEELEAKPSAAA